MLARTLKLGDGTYVSPTTATTRVRGGGYGRSAWIATITGTDPKWGLNRRFINADRSGLSGSGASGIIDWTVAPDESGVRLVEWRDFCIGSTSRNWRSSGYAIITSNTVRELSKKEVLSLATILDTGKLDNVTWKLLREGWSGSIAELLETAASVQALAVASETGSFAAS